MSSERADRLASQLKADAFHAASVPAYAGDHALVYKHIDDHLDEHLDNVRRWLRQRSVSTEPDGIPQMAALVQQDLDALGFDETAIVPTSGNPAVWGYFDAGAEKTLMIYMMYDVQPVDPTDWSVPPFEAELVDNDLGTVVMARGSADAKGPERALLNAMESIIAVDGTLPVNLMVTAEGEEEMGSPHYGEVIDHLGDRLRTCEAVFFPFLRQDAEGATSLCLGVKGILYIELEVRGGSRGGPGRTQIGSALKVLVDSPTWRLVQALASMTSEDGNTITIPGFLDAVREPSDEELRLVAGMVDDWGEREVVMKEQFSVSQWVDGLEGSESLLRNLFDCSLNIDGLSSGWTEPGVVAIIPHDASAKVDARLVPDQRPDELVPLIRSHLDAHGFDDIEIRVVAAYPPSQTSVEAPAVLALISVLNKHGYAPSVAPRTSGSAPWYQFTERLGLPVVEGGLGHGSGAHGPDEFLVIHPKPHLRIAGLAEMEKTYVDFLYAAARSDI